LKREIISIIGEEYLEEKPKRRGKEEEEIEEI
jgi:hypothetical protein